MMSACRGLRGLAVQARDGAREDVEGHLGLLQLHRRGVHVIVPAPQGELSDSVGIHYRPKPKNRAQHAESYPVSGVRDRLSSTTKMRRKKSRSIGRSAGTMNLADGARRVGRSRK